MSKETAPPLILSRVERDSIAEEVAALIGATLDVDAVAEDGELKIGDLQPVKLPLVTR